uniref:Dehydrogenase/reductase 11 n=1 Tax=Ailuropoda melanoleuca TaxID=9646 RepID=G1LNT8_AILME
FLFLTLALRNWEGRLNTEQGYVRPRAWSKPPLNLGFPAPLGSRSTSSQDTEARAGAAGSVVSHLPLGLGRGRKGRGGQAVTVHRLDVAGLEGAEGGAPIWGPAEWRRVQARLGEGQIRGYSARGGNRRAAEPLRPGAELRDPNVRLAERCVRAARDHRQGWHGAVTGASGGIGAAVARALVQQGLKVVGCARTVGNIEVNMLALSICTQEAYQSMKEREVDDGHIININSMSGHQVSPQSVIHFYSATKYAVTALTEGLRQELREAQTHIRAMCISPEVVETQFAFKLHDKDPEKAAATYERIKCFKPEDVAEAVIYVLSTPPHVQIGDIQMRPTEQVI